MLSSGDDTEVNVLGGVEEGIGFQVDMGEGICCNIARSLDMAYVGHELGDVVQVSYLPGERSHVGHGSFVYIMMNPAVLSHFCAFPSYACDCTWCACDYYETSYSVWQRARIGGH